MSAEFPVRAQPVRPHYRGGSRRSLLIALGAAGAAVVIAQLYSLWVGSLSVDLSVLAYVAFLLAVIGLMLLAARLDGRSLKDFGFFAPANLSLTLLFATLLLMTELALRLDPGFLFGFGKVPAAAPLGFGYLLLTAPLLAVAEVGFFFGYLTRTLSRSLSLRNAVLLSAGFFALFSTNLPFLPILGPSAAVEYIFSTTLVSFVLGILVALYYYKSQWNLVGPLAYFASVYAILSLLPVGVDFPSWEIQFTSVLIADAVLLLIVGVGLREPRLQSLRYLGERIGPKRYRFRYRAREERETRGLLWTGAVVGVVAISFVYGLPQVLGTAHPILAIATGSMVPTLERGTLVVVEHVAPAAITVGTIIAFSVACLPSPTVHRVIQIVSGGPNWVFQTKGDANHAKDPCTVPYSAVEGAVVGIVPYVGFLILDPLFAASLVILLIVIPLAWRSPRL